MQIHNGQSSIWSTPWCEIWESIYDHIKLPTTVQRLPQSVADLWNPQTRSWNNDLISQIFDDQATQCIIQTPIVPSDSSDIIRWKPARKGVCTTKEAFRLLNNQQQVQLPQQGAKGITPQALQILKRTWKHKNLPPCIKAFARRLIRRALATGDRAGNLSSKINKHCTTCNMIENDSRLFFHCTFARAVWFAASPPYRLEAPTRTRWCTGYITNDHWP